MMRGQKLQPRRATVWFEPLRDFPDDEGTEGGMRPRLAEGTLLRDFPDDEGTEGHCLSVR